MTEEFILSYIATRMAQLGCLAYHIRFRDFGIGANDSLMLEAYNQLFFLVGSPQDIEIESLYGLYDSTGEAIAENTYQHKGEILITNHSDSLKRVRFIQVIIVN